MSIKPKILVTGGAGYIGSHTLLTLKRAGYEIVVLDNLVYGHRDLVERVLQVELVIGDLNDSLLLEKIFCTHSIEAVIHFAAYAYVGESVKTPLKYYDNNVVGTLNLLKTMKATSVNKLVFSSTCATYGVPENVPISEEDQQNPLNPYGASKLMVERIISDLGKAYGLKSVCFRYFNAAGAEPSGLLGEDHTPETHLIPLVLLAALGKQEKVSIFGDDYPTSDGTCIRDYIHVCDLAKAHLLGLEYLLAGNESTVFNLGNGNGFSVKEVIETVQQISQRDFLVERAPRRPGDPPILISNSDKARSLLGWKPQYPDLSDLVDHAWQWHQRRHGAAIRLVGK